MSRLSVLSSITVLGKWDGSASGKVLSRIAAIIPILLLSGGCGASAACGYLSAEEAEAALEYAASFDGTEQHYNGLAHHEFCAMGWCEDMCQVPGTEFSFNAISAAVFPLRFPNINSCIACARQIGRQAWANCGNGTCDPDETCGRCPSDCPICDICGNGICENSESCFSCYADCPVCDN